MTKPVAPFLSAQGHIEVHQIPVAQDNLSWLIRVTGSDEAAVVDGTEAEAVLAYCKKLGVRLTTVLNTHTHWDHIGVNLGLRALGLLSAVRVVGSKLQAHNIPGLTHPVGEGDVVSLGSASAKVLLTEGHMDGHICFLFDDILFCGDTLFGGGCGYIFDGPPSKMHHSLNRLATLPRSTRVCCAHEYTEDNMRFAWSVEPDNELLKERVSRVRQVRQKGGCTVPSTIGEELDTNPFMRCDSPTIAAKLRSTFPSRDLSSSEAIFTAIRELKDRKDYKQL
ncbi:MAG: hydroxyacylglutathione hydrolase [Myxococcota bacterium]